MRILIILLLLVLSPLSAVAQIPGVTPEAPASSDAGIDELIRIIENDETRAALIERLKRTSAEAPAPDETAPDLNIVRQLAEYTKTAAEGASATLRSLAGVFVELQRGLSGALDADLDAFRDVAIGVLLVAAVLVVGYLIIRVVVSWARGVIAGRVAGRGWAARILGALVAASADFGAVLLVWAVGYAAALALAGE